MDEIMNCRICMNGFLYEMLKRKIAESKASYAEIDEFVETTTVDQVPNCKYGLTHMMAGYDRITDLANITAICPVAVDADGKPDLEACTNIMFFSRRRRFPQQP
jgi:hypothetical protein